MLDLRFVIGAILAAAVLAVSSFALYATVQMMRQAKQGVAESSRVPTHAAEDWHRYQPPPASPGPPDVTPAPDAVSIVLSALPKGTPRMAEGLAQRVPDETAPSSAGSGKDEDAVTIEPAPERPAAPLSASVQTTADPSVSQGAVTGSVAAPGTQQAAPRLPQAIPIAPRSPVGAPASRLTARELAPEREDAGEQRPKRRAVAVEHRSRVYVRPRIEHQPRRRSLYGGKYWQLFGY